MHLSSRDHGRPAGGARSTVGSFAFAAAPPRLWGSDARRSAMSQPDLSQVM